MTVANKAAAKAVSKPIPKAVPAKKVASSSNERQPTTVTVNSISDFLKELDKLDYVKRGYWFRGIGNVEHSLTPSLFRHKTAKTQADYKLLELGLNETFEMRSLPYVESRNWAQDEWERLFFMQHYRVPTRLLDWSGSPLVAMHFALTSVKSNPTGEPATDAAVWILDPKPWNDAAFADTGFPGGVLSARNSWLNRYSPSAVYTHQAALPPVAMRGVHNSARIVAQQGFFTVFGGQAFSMEKSFCLKKDEAFVFPETSLQKIVIPRAAVKKVLLEIFSLGISESTIYPDLEGLAAELKRTFGF